MTLRIRCEVLAVITDHDDLTSIEVSEKLPHLENMQVQRAIYKLLDQDRIYKTGTSPRKGRGGGPVFKYRARANWEPTEKEPATKKGRKKYKDRLKAGNGQMIGIVRFRDRKVRLLVRLMRFVHDSDRDLLQGIMADYGHVPVSEIADD